MCFGGDNWVKSVFTSHNCKVGCSTHGHWVNRRSASWARAFTSTAPAESKFLARPAGNCHHQNQVKKKYIYICAWTYSTVFKFQKYAKTGVKELQKWRKKTIFGVLPPRRKKEKWRQTIFAKMTELVTLVTILWRINCFDVHGFSCKVIWKIHYVYSKDAKVVFYCSTWHWRNVHAQKWHKMCSKILMQLLRLVSYDRKSK